MSLIFKKSTAQPQFDVAASITGTLEATQTLTCSYTVTKARAANVTVRWYRHTASDGSDPTGVQIATGATYTLTGTDVGNYIRAIVTAINPAGTVTSTSAYTAIITSGDPPTPPALDTPAAITGTADVGETLTVTYSFTGQTSVAIQWYSYATEPTGNPLVGTDEVLLGTASTQALTESEAGRWIGVVVTATNAVDDTHTSASVAMAGVDAYSAALPTAYDVPPYELPTGGTTWYPTSSAELRTALANCQPGDVIVLDADTTYTGRFEINEPAKTPTGEWIYVISSRMANLPPDGGRVVCGWEAVRQGVPDNSVDMPKLQFTVYTTSTNARHGLWFTNGATGPAFRNFNASYWRFCGLEMSIEVAEGDLQYSMVQVYGDNIVFDRCYLHGTPDDNRQNRDGFVLYSAGKKAIKGCHVSDFKGTNIESHAIHVYSQIDPCLIENNFISAASIPLFVGDSNDDTFGAHLKDITIRGNHIYKPDSYRQTHPSWNGIAYQIKNQFEIKHGRRVLVEGNLLENSFDGGDQSGQWLNLNAIPAPVEDFTYRNNVIYGCNNGNLASYGGAVTRVVIQNNLFFNIGGWGIPPTGAALWWMNLARGRYVTIENNTVYYPDRTYYGATIFFNGTRYNNFNLDYHRVRNNVFIGGVNSDLAGSGVNGKQAVLDYCGDNYHYQNNVVLYGRGGTTYWTYPTGHEDGKWENFYFPTTLAGVGYTDTAFADVDDFELAVSSPYYAVGTGGSRPGITASAITAVLNDSMPTA